MDVEETTFKGKSYKVYPVRLGYGLSGGFFLELRSSPEVYTTKKASAKKLLEHQDMVLSRSFSDFKLEKKIQYSPFSLPDGEYVAYYIKIPYKYTKKRVPIYRPVDSTRVAVVFTIKNNLLEGSATWYDFFDQDFVIQRSSYSEGRQNGQWETTFGKNSFKYSYKLDSLDGEYSFTKGKYVVEKGRYERGRMTESTKYYANKSVKTYFRNGWDGNYISYEYFKNGKLRECINKTDTATFYEMEYNDKGRLTYLSTLDTQSQTKHIKEFDYKGRLQAETKESLSLLNSSIGEVLRSQRDLRSSYGGLIWIKEYKIDGSLLFSYEVGQPNKTVYRILDKRGNLKESLYFTNDSDLVHVSVDKRTKSIDTYAINDGSTASSFVFYMNGRSSLDYYKVKEEVYEKDKLIYLSYNSAEYADNRFQDSLGFVLFEYRKYRRGTSSNFYLLHNGYFREENYDEKDKIQMDSFVSKVIVSEKDTSLWMSRTEYSKDGRLTVVHQNTVPYVKVKPRNTFYNYDHNYGKGHGYEKNIDNWIWSSLRGMLDTILYKVYYDNTLVTGKMTIDTEYPKRSQSEGMHKVKRKVDKLGNVSFTVKNIARYYDYRKIILQNGVPNGKVSTGYNHTFYLNGLKDGYSETKKESGFYRKGMKNGRFIDYGSNSISDYKDNVRHGDYLEKGLYYKRRQPTQLRLRSHFENGRLEGKLQRYAYPYVTYEDGTFENGILQGAYTSGTEVNNKLVEVTLKDGMLVDTGKYFFREGTLKCKVIYSEKDRVLPIVKRSRYTFSLEPLPTDSVKRAHYIQEFYDYKTARMLNENPGYDNNSQFVIFNPELSGEYTYFYKSGVASQHGMILNGEKVGVWKYYDVNGGMHKEVDYTSGDYLLPHTIDSLHYYAKITSFYPNGKLLLKGLVIDEKSRFKCEQEQDISMEEVHYLEFYDRVGNQTLSESGGYVYQYHNDGSVRLEGEYADGKRNGLWKFYDPDGLLEELGEYKDGKKNGLWFEGDLQGVPYFDNACNLGEVEDRPSIAPQNAGMIIEKIGITRTEFYQGFPQRSTYVTFYPF
ncbi:MAG: hypothetical protein COA58_14710 [Bacteroidetes bacterium]|nr:MAG: hypothetical protein COA58_14710 [Bacteroidota bacterium]